MSLFLVVDLSCNVPPAKGAAVCAASPQEYCSLNVFTSAGYTSPEQTYPIVHGTRCDVAVLCGLISVDWSWCLV